MAAQINKGCPFCGDPNDLECVKSATPNKFEVYCNSCFCAGPTADTEDEAIEAWNERPESLVPAQTSYNMPRFYGIKKGKGK